MLTGAPITAAEAAEIGLVTEVVEPGASWERALPWATRFAPVPVAALRLPK